MSDQMPVFKEYNIDQLIMFPQNLSELVPQNHQVRIVNSFVDELDLREIELMYKGGGTSSYHYRMMLKAIIYAYTEKIYSSRMIAKALRENVNFMWIAAGNKPDFRTINRFRLMLTKTIGDVFYSIVELLYEKGYVKLENYFLDGTKIEANANKYSFVWKKSMEKNKKRLQENVKELLKHIEEENEKENRLYGDKDLEELGEETPIDLELLKQRAKELSRRIKEEPKNKSVKKALKKIETDYLPRLEKYEQQEELFNGRNSYSKTDTDATFMRMKEDHMKNGQLKAGYNVQIGTENQFIVGYSIHQRPTDTGTLIPHLEEVKAYLPKMPDNVVTDAGYGSEENYNYLENETLGNYVKFNNFRIEDTKKFKKDKYRVENLPYNAEKDEYLCPEGKSLKFSHVKNSQTDLGYNIELKIYECESCDGCPVKTKCHKGNSNRHIQINPKLNEFRKNARENLNSEKGLELRRLRGVEVESCFGDIKWNASFRRFLLRGLKKTGLEWGLVSIGHNFRKIKAILSKNGLFPTTLSANLSFS